MPNLQALKKLFKELESKGGKKLYRTGNASKLADEGFDEALQMADSRYNKTTWGEPGGIYYANRPKDVGNLRMGSKLWEGKDVPDITAIPLPSARTKSFTAAEWEPQFSKTKEELTKELKPNYDLVEFPDLVTNQPNLRQTVQLNPKSVLARIKTDKGIKYKILSLTAMLTAAGATPDEITGVTDMFKTKEANAMPLGKLLKAGTKEALKAAEGLPSSTAKVLKGKSLEGTAIQGMKLDSKIVADVKSGIGNWRNIIFEDGSSLPVTTDFLESIMREHGKATYAAKRAVMTAEEQLKEAEASLQYHLNRTYTEGKNRPVKFQEKHSQRMNELVGPERGAEMIGFWHGRRYVIMPKYQAEILERNGKGRIDRSKIGVIPQ